MAVTSILATRAIAITEDNQTRYLRVCGHRDAGTLTEAQVEIPFRDAGTLANLYVYCSANNIRADSTFTVRVNQATPTNSLSVVYGNSQTGIKGDTTNTVTIAATDEVDIQLVTSNDPSTRTLTHQSHKVEFTATSGTVTVMSAGSVTTAANFSTASTTYYSAPNGSLHVLTTNEAERHSFVVKGTLTASDLYCHVTSNGRTTDTTIRSRVDQANGNMSVVYGSGQTGGKEDASNTDDLSSGSDYNYSITTGTGTGTLSMSLISSSLVSSTGALAELAAMYPAVDTIAAGTTQWISPNGAYWWTGTEANVSTTVRCNFTAKLMRASVVTNGGTLTLTMRKAGSNTSQQIVYSSGQTGYKEDATNTVDFTSGDTGFCYQASKDAGSAATMAWIGCSMVPTVSTIAAAISGDSTVAGLIKATAEASSAVSGATHHLRQ